MDICIVIPYRVKYIFNIYIYLIIYNQNKFNSLIYSIFLVEQPTPTELYLIKNLNQWSKTPIIENIRPTYFTVNKQMINLRLYL